MCSNLFRVILSSTFYKAKKPQLKFYKKKLNLKWFQKYQTFCELDFLSVVFCLSFFFFWAEITFSGRSLSLWFGYFLFCAEVLPSSVLFCFTVSCPSPVVTCVLLVNQLLCIKSVRSLPFFVSSSAQLPVLFCSRLSQFHLPFLAFVPRAIPALYRCL